MARQPDADKIPAMPFPAEPLAMIQTCVMDRNALLRSNDIVLGCLAVPLIARTSIERCEPGAGGLGFFAGWVETNHILV